MTDKGAWQGYWKTRLYERVRQRGYESRLASRIDSPEHWG